MPIWSILLIVSVSLFAGAGVFALERLVPASRREPQNEVVGFVYAVVGVAYAVLLGLVVIAAWNTLDEATANTYAESNALMQLAWYGHSLPQPQQAEVEHLVEAYTTLVINTEWPELAHQESSPQAWSVYIQLRNLVQAQQPTTPSAVARYQQALDAGSQLGDTRRERIEQAAEGIPALLWGALVIGGIVTVGFAYFFGMKSKVSHSLVMFSLSLIFSCLLLVVFELNYPFGGIVKVSPEAFKLALAQMQLVF
jgi:hypothetical protein